LKIVENRKVCVVVDGVADIAGLKAADVGICMGLAGQNVSMSSREQQRTYLQGTIMRDKAGIVIMDDNFLSVFNAARWGHNIYDNCRKFVQC
jgi:P-type Ca2+ transporter type 2C